jgi:hypothetical protein
MGLSIGAGDPIVTVKFEGEQGRYVRREVAVPLSKPTRVNSESLLDEP